MLFTSARADDLMSQKSAMITYEITVGYVTLYSFWYVYVTTYDLKIVLYFDFDKTCPPPSSAKCLMASDTLGHTHTQ